MNNDKIIFGISRFSNIGGITCYINSILHILQQVPIFADYIYSKHFVESLKQNIPQEHLMKQTTSYELHRLFIASINNDNSSITPTTFKNVIGTKNSMWNERNHQDSQEFLSFLWHHQFHPLRNAREGIGLRCRPQRGSAIGLCRDRPHL